MWRRPEAGRWKIASTLNGVLENLRAHESELQRLGVSHAAVLGSIARGEATGASDVDVLVELDDQRPMGIFEWFCALPSRAPGRNVRGRDGRRGVGASEMTPATRDNPIICTPVRPVTDHVTDEINGRSLADS